MMQAESIEMVKATRLIPHPLGLQIYGEPRNTADFEQLVESIRVHGILEPLVVTTDLVILSGHRRAMAAIEAGVENIPVRKVKNLSETDQLELITTLNHHRKRLPSDMVREALAIEKLDCTLKKGEILATKVGFNSKRSFEQAKRIVLSNDQSLIKLMDQRTITTAYRKLHRKEGISTYSPIIKPSDNWNFSPVQYPRIDKNENHGYIPGDIYANCFWYFVKPNDLVVDPMAGSGMAKHVYEHRHEWMGTNIYDFRLMLFDLTPQTKDIKQHDLLKGFPVEKVDYIFIDLPYLGMVNKTYSNKKQDIANMDEDSYLKSIARIAKVCADAQKTGKLCTIISPNYTDHKKQKIVNIVEYIRESWRFVGYKLYLETYSSRRIQSSQGIAMAKMNNIAKERRLPLTDMTVIMTFERI
ncbi:MAG: hypothetical protein BWK78_05205 [Thiotrichaceae bacterium IS1]|nr:MAG: hypothetical protein BWK78_05205 [Thiotrichaceae bacterium IS1]